MTKKPMDTDLEIRMSPPLGLYTIASMFKDEHRVTVENESIHPVNSLPRAIEIAREYRKRNIKVVAGGIHITCAWKNIPPNIFDALVIGAAENTWPQIMYDLQHGTLQPIYSKMLAALKPLGIKWHCAASILNPLTFRTL